MEVEMLVNTITLPLALADATAVVDAAAAAETCYICYEESTEENVLLDPNPCSCKGSIRIHKLCLQEVMKLSQTCSICKTPYNKPELAGCICRIIPYNEIPPSYRYGVGDLKEYYKTDADGKKHGTSRIYATAFEHYTNQLGHLGQVLVEEANYEHGRLHGTRRLWNYSGHRNGTPTYYPTFELTYVGGEVDGPFKTYEMRSHYVAEEGTLRRGVPISTHGDIYIPAGYYVGEYKKYSLLARQLFDIHEPVEHLTYKDDGTLADGPQKSACVRANYYSEKLIVGSTHCNYKNGAIDGEFISLNFHGEVLDQGTYKSGKRVGAYVHYDADVNRDGNNFGRRYGIEEHAQYKDGRLHGHCKIMYNGRLVLSGTYSNGRQIGTQRIYQEGRLMEVTTLKSDGSCELHGPAAFYDPYTGALVQTCNYKNGFFDGPLRLYNERGVCTVSIIMKNGRPKEGSQMRLFDVDGNLDETRIIEYGTFLCHLAEDLGVSIRDATSSDDVGLIVTKNFNYNSTYAELRRICKELTDGCECANCEYWRAQESECECPGCRDYYRGRRYSCDSESDYDYETYNEYRSPRDLRGWVVRD